MSISRASLADNQGAQGGRALKRFLVVPWKYNQAQLTNSMRDIGKLTELLPRNVHLERQHSACCAGGD